MYFPLIDFSLMWTSLPFVLQGLVYTLGIGFVSFLLGNLVGLLLTVLGLLDWLPLNVFIRFYLSFFRGIPALVLLFLLYFGLPYQLSALTASVICFTITSSAFIGEIYRGSLAGVSSGQWDAGLASGFSFFGVLKYIVLPQAFRISVPALSNVAMDLVKGTSLAATITVPEIFQKAKIIGGRTFDYFSL
ncbi:TPA: amino acid ABC transporter permease, partial [Enterococcus faecium]|nr:amino acid ABC transporter permease [Enterococcus faecium]HAQ8983340.1 amino acid ABC transporter permease [Enterococcus faecium]HAQ9005884.1 amino acid ABC transporter permease [Enterococcus faecium]HAQ9078244.1 amino acid ABC transporter permease [Enterococcus faecium]HAQ9137479.1 amino acid ABC transporter permease [Enterococcus faecium]